MSKIKEEFVDQHRWNHYGLSKLQDINQNPEKYIVDLQKLDKIQSDLIGTIGDIKGKTVLEFGSGYGEFSVALAKLGARVTGIDIGSDLVKLSNLVAELNDVRCEFVTGSVDKLDFENESFDFVIGRDILHHLPKHMIINSLNEAYRVIKPEGKACFIEPIENSKLFDFIQNLFPLGSEPTYYRPSILQRAKWKKYIREADDRSLSTNELINAKNGFSKVNCKYYGLFIRLTRIFHGKRFRRVLNNIDSLLTKKYSPIKKLSQQILVIYEK